MLRSSQHLRQAQIMALNTEGVALESSREELKAAENSLGGFTAYGRSPGYKIGKLKSRTKGKFDKAVINDLKNLGYKDMKRGWHVIEKSGLKLPLTDVDIAWSLPSNEEGKDSAMVALELDEELNFLHDVSGVKAVKRDIGTTSKTRLLKGLGWHVTHLSSSHWKIIRKRPESERRAFWSKKLSPLGVLNSWEEEWGVDANGAKVSEEEIIRKYLKTDDPC